MNIGEAAAAAGVKAKMIRHYESIGLIGPVRRNEAGYRQYIDKDIHTLRFIKRARWLGFAMKESGLLLSLWRNERRPSADVKELALAHVRDLDAKICELQAMRDIVNHLADTCHGDQRPDCPILDSISAGEK